MAAAAGRSHITKAKCHFFKNDNFNQVLTELPSAGMIAKTKGERSCSGSPRGLPGACRPLHMLCTRPQMHGTARAPECPAQVLPPPPLPRRRHLAGRSPLLLLGRRGSCPVLPALHRSRHHCGAGMPDGGQAGGAAGGGRDVRAHRPHGAPLLTRQQMTPSLHCGWLVQCSGRLGSRCLGRRCSVQTQVVPAWVAAAAGRRSICAGQGVHVLALRPLLLVRPNRCGPCPPPAQTT